MRVTRVRHHFILPCCLLALNLVNQAIGAWATPKIASPSLRALFIMAMVLFGSSLVGFLVAPALEGLLENLYRGSKRRGGFAGEWAFVGAFGALMFWLYYRVTVSGPGALLP